MKDIAAEIAAAYSREGLALRETFFRTQTSLLCEAALRAAVCLAGGGKILLCGNGGDAACAQHLAAEFVHGCSMDRPALPALALCADAATLTAIGDGLDFSQVFARQVEALGRPGDMLVGISSAGAGADVIAALLTARRKGIVTLCLAQEDGELPLRCDLALTMPAAAPALMQEVQLAAGHMLCRLTDYYLFENVAALTPLL